MNKTKQLVTYGLLIAIIVLMAFTPIGYIKTPIVEITLIVIPVAVGAIILGPAAGAVLGGVFGLTSFIQCFGLSQFGAALLAISPALTFIMCMIPRIIMGFMCGYVFGLIKKKNPNPPVPVYGLAALVAPLLNTILFVGCVIVFFGNSEVIQGIRGGANFIAFIAAFVGVNGLIEIIVTFIVGGAIAAAVRKALK